MLSLTIAPVVDRLREAFLLQRAQRTVESRSADRQSKIRELADAVDVRLAVVDSLTAGDQIPAALVLLRDAAILAIRAVLESRGIDADEQTAEGAFRRLTPLVESGDLPAPPKEWTRVRDLLSDTRHLAFDELSGPDALARRTEAEALVAWLRILVEARTVSEIKASRVIRLGVVGLLVLGGLTWGVTRVSASKNLALGKPAQMSSRRPSCPPGAGEAGLPPSGAVDGNKAGAYDICTSYEVRPWLTIDLQSVHKLSKAVIYYRGDCCQGAYDLPAVLEVSEDGTTWTEVGRRTTAYSAQDPWTVPIDGKRAKIVRLRVDSNDSKELVLNEVEVYGR
jgi:hypothetical protein